MVWFGFSSPFISKVSESWGDIWSGICFPNHCNYGRFFWFIILIWLFPYISIYDILLRWLKRIILHAIPCKESAVVLYGFYRILYGRQDLEKYLSFQDLIIFNSKCMHTLWLNYIIFVMINSFYKGKYIKGIFISSLYLEIFLTWSFENNSDV